MIYLLLLIPIAAVLFFVFRNKKAKSSTPSYITPVGGAIVYSPVEVPLLALDAIDNGLRDQILRMPPEWTKGRMRSEYRIQFTAPQATNQFTAPGSPALIVSGIQAAGTVINFNTYPTILVPHQEDTNWAYLDYLTNSIHNEAEHISEFWNDKAEFDKWVYPNPDIHPHRP